MIVNLTAFKQNFLECITFLTISLQIIQICIYYYEELLRKYFYILLILWFFTRASCTLISYILGKRSLAKENIKQALKILFTYELLVLYQQRYQNQHQKLIKGFIGQIHLYTVPVTLINQHIITSKEYNHYTLECVLVIFMIINLVLLSFCNLLSALSNFQQKKIKLSIIFSIQLLFRAFSFWYIMAQLLSYSFLIIIAWFVIHFFIGICITSITSNSGNSLEYFISFILQLDIFILKHQQNEEIGNLQNDQEVKPQRKMVIEWRDAIYYFMLQLNILFFFLLKITYCTVQIKIDYFTYAIYSFTVPMLIMSVKQIYQRASIIINYKEVIQWKYGSLKLKKNVQYLCKNLVKEGKIYINLEEVRTQINNLISLENQKCCLTNYQYPQKKLIWINQKQYFEDLKEIKSSLKMLDKGRFQSMQIHFYDQTQNIQIIFLNDENHSQHQKIILKPGFDKNFAFELFDFLQYLINPIHLIPVDVKDIDLINLRFPSIRFERDCFVQNNFHKNIISNVISCNFQALVFYKQLSKIVPLNPSLILFDLFDNTQ